MPQAPPPQDRSLSDTYPVNMYVDLFGVSRTLVREAMARLSARGMVEVNARRGWFVVQPSLDEAREAFGARMALETGLLHGLTGPCPRVRCSA